MYITTISRENACADDVTDASLVRRARDRRQDGDAAESSDLSDEDGHINLFKDEEKSKQRSEEIRLTRLRERREQLDAMRRQGVVPWELGRSAATKRWYERRSGERSSSEDEGDKSTSRSRRKRRRSRSERLSDDRKRKRRDDPLRAFEVPSTEDAEKRRDRSRPRTTSEDAEGVSADAKRDRRVSKRSKRRKSTTKKRKKRERRKKKDKKAAASSSDDKMNALRKLRIERGVREGRERARQEKMLARRASAGTILAAREARQFYSQFNPSLARRRRS